MQLLSFIVAVCRRINERSCGLPAEVVRYIYRIRRAEFSSTTKFFTIQFTVLILGNFPAYRTITFQPQSPLLYTFHHYFNQIITILDSPNLFDNNISATLCEYHNFPLRTSDSPDFHQRDQGKHQRLDTNLKKLLLPHQRPTKLLISTHADRPIFLQI